MSLSPYRFVSSGLVQHGEELFPFSCFADAQINWDEVGLWLNTHEWEGE